MMLKLSEQVRVDLNKVPRSILEQPIEKGLQMLKMWVQL